MGRPRKPKNILILSGAHKNHPERMRAREGEPEETRPLGVPPEHLTPSERLCWDEITANSIPGVLGEADRMAVEVASVLFAKLRARNYRGFELAQLNRLLGRFGMTPSDRASINIPKAKPKNIFGED